MTARCPRNVRDVESIRSWPTTISVLALGRGSMEFRHGANHVRLLRQAGDHRSWSGCASIRGSTHADHNDGVTDEKRLRSRENYRALKADPVAYAAYRVTRRAYYHTRKVSDPAWYAREMASQRVRMRAWRAKRRALKGLS